MPLIHLRRIHRFADGVKNLIFSRLLAKIYHFFDRVLLDILYDLNAEHVEKCFVWTFEGENELITPSDRYLTSVGKMSSYRNLTDYKIDSSRFIWEMMNGFNLLLQSCLCPQPCYDLTGHTYLIPTLYEWIYPLARLVVWKNPQSCF